jgi:predicted glycogen debranching enzyme
VYFSTNRWGSGIVEPQGFRHIEKFRLEGATPVWTFASSDALVEKRVWMEQGENTTYVQYTLIRGSAPARLSVKVLVNYRDFHAVTRAGNWHMDVRPEDHGLAITAFDGARTFFLRSAPATVQAAHEWCRDFNLFIERERGLDDHEDLLHAGTFHGELEEGQALTLVFSTQPDRSLDGTTAFRRRLKREAELLRNLGRWQPDRAQLVLAADQFIVDRVLDAGIKSSSIIAGYPWFGDWGRDTMIALPGLTLVTGRPDIARSILYTFSQFVDSGMLPNYLSRSGEPAHYNSVDAALWYIEAVRQYFQATGDTDFLQACFPVLEQIIDSYSNGTRFNIHADKDGLITAGEAGIQVTWMDAKVGDLVVTPRMGKPIEINALWLNALSSVATFAKAIGKPATRYEEFQQRVVKSFPRFWNENLGYCFDVLDGPAGDDETLRPNQIFAVSLQATALTPNQQRGVVDACARHLLTSFGLRSLAPESVSYHGHCYGRQVERDSAYHQGTVWGWLLGPFALAHYRVYKARIRAQSFLQPLLRHINDYGLGTIGEIFDGDPPFAPRGCIAQAWSVGELLRAWSLLEEDLRDTHEQLA